MTPAERAALIHSWRVNYGLDTRTPAEAADWWREQAGGSEVAAPAGAVAALGVAIEVIEALVRGKR